MSRFRFAAAGLVGLAITGATIVGLSDKGTPVAGQSTGVGTNSPGRLDNQEREREEAKWAEQYEKRKAERLEEIEKEGLNYSTGGDDTALAVSLDKKANEIVVIYSHNGYDMAWRMPFIAEEWTGDMNRYDMRGIERLRSFASSREIPLTEEMQKSIQSAKELATTAVEVDEAGNRDLRPSSYSGTTAVEVESNNATGNGALTNKVVSASSYSGTIAVELKPGEEPDDVRAVKVPSRPVGTNENGNGSTEPKHP